eukprot:3271260-Rhodomonas_salina.1
MCTLTLTDRLLAAHTLPVDVVPHGDGPDDYVRLAPVGREVLHVDVVPVVVPAVLALECLGTLEVDPCVLTVRVHAGDDSKLVESGLGQGPGLLHSLARVGPE